jgi:hypothetical protein
VVPTQRQVQALVRLVLVQRAARVLARPAQPKLVALARPAQLVRVLLVLNQFCR